MSDINEARAIRYLIDAIDDRLLIEAALEKKIFSQALFHSQQLSEKASKACLSALKILPVDDHKYADALNYLIIPNSKKLKQRFYSIMTGVTKLESEYIPARYGVSKSGNVSLKSYDETEVVNLCKPAFEYLDLCFEFIEERAGKKLPRQQHELVQLLIKEYSDHVKMR
jgi:HEPN domain-containing protein